MKTQIEDAEFIYELSVFLLINKKTRTNTIINFIFKDPVSTSSTSTDALNLCRQALHTVRHTCVISNFPRPHLAFFTSCCTRKAISSTFLSDVVDRSQVFRQAQYHWISDYRNSRLENNDAKNIFLQNFRKMSLSTLYTIYCKSNCLINVIKDNIVIGLLKLRAVCFNSAVLYWKHYKDDIFKPFEC